MIMRLLEALVDSVLLYGAEVWGWCRQTDLLVQVQLRATRIFLGVGRLHRMLMLANLSRNCGSIDSIIKTNN